MTNSPRLWNRERNSQRKLSRGAAALSATFNPLNKEQVSTPQRGSKPVNDRSFCPQESLCSSTPKITPERKRSVFSPEKSGNLSTRNTTPKTSQPLSNTRKGSSLRGTPKTKEASPTKLTSLSPQHNKTILSSSRIPQRMHDYGRDTHSKESCMMLRPTPDFADTSVEELDVNSIPTKSLPITSTPKSSKSLEILDLKPKLKEEMIPVHAIKDSEPSKRSTKIPTFRHSKPSHTTRNTGTIKDANTISKIPQKTLSSSYNPHKESQAVLLRTGERKSTRTKNVTPKKSPERTRLQCSSEQKAQASGKKIPVPSRPTKCPASVNASISATSTKTSP